MHRVAQDCKYFSIQHGADGFHVMDVCDELALPLELVLARVTGVARVAQVLRIVRAVRVVRVVRAVRVVVRVVVLAAAAAVAVLLLVLLLGHRVRHG